MFKKRLAKTLLVGLSLILISTFSAPAQAKRKTAKQKTAKKAEPVKAQTAAEDDATPAIKKNSRPEDESQITAIEKTEETVKTKATGGSKPN